MRGVNISYDAPLTAFGLDTPSPEDYDSEDEFDDFDASTMIDIENHPFIHKDEDGTTILEYDEDDEEDDLMKAIGKGGQVEKPRPATADTQDGGDHREGDPEEEFFFRDLLDLDEPDFISPPSVDRLVPLRAHGEDVDDFVEAMIEHPTKYAEFRRANPHSDSLREAKADFPKNRQQPPDEFVTSHKRFLYVTGIPHFLDNETGEAGDFENPIHRHEVIKFVVKQFGVPDKSVSPANMTSAFIGFEEKGDAKLALKNGPKEKIFSSPIVMQEYEVDDGVELGFPADSALVKLSNVPPGMSARYLAVQLFRKDSELGSIYGVLTPDDVKKVSATEAIVRLQSPEQVESALSSSMVRQRLDELGTSRVRHFKAKRELQYAGYTGPGKGQRFRKRGPRLVVSGDKPTDGFFRSHAACLQLRQVDPSVTKQEISDFFQSFCQRARDVVGSVEFVTCANGDRTDRVYVGFDRADEAKAAVAACSGFIDLGMGSINVKSVKDLGIPGATPPEVRPERSEEELLESLHNWEAYVDAKDVEELEAHGVRREVLADTFRTMRYHNVTYGPMDWSMKREKLSPERYPEPGQHMRETMQMYVETLKECIATPENPGFLYESMFFEDEEMDFDAFEAEERRLQKLAEERALIKT